MSGAIGEACDGTWRFTTESAFFCASVRDGGGDAGRGRFEPEEPRYVPPLDVQRPVRTSSVAGHLVSELISRLRASDRDALEIIYKALFPSLWRLALLRTRSSETAEEVVHDVFLSLWARRESAKLDLDIPVYLAVAVRNRTRDLGAHDRVVHAVEDAVSRAMLDPPGTSQQILSPDAALEIGEFHIVYHRALMTLSDREREAALLRWEEGFTFEQVGQVLGISAVGARKVILRAQEKVQAGLADYRNR